MKNLFHRHALIILFHINAILFCPIPLTQSVNAFSLDEFAFVDYFNQLIKIKPPNYDA